MQQLNNIVTSLRNKGFRITPQRIAIINYLLNTDLHPTVEEIYKVIQKKYPMISMATIYKTVDFLKNMGIVQELCFVEGSARYDANIDKHINIVCMRCGRIEDINEQSLSILESKVTERSRYQVFGRRFELYGYCNNCKNKRD
jgi:Fur family transcriptional regulator, peroxide stress response regulator